MLSDAWSLGLLSCSAITLFLTIVGVKTGWRILRYWDMSSGSEQQIRLEEEVYLGGVLVEFGFVVQLLSAIMLVLAADYFSTILVGAMCATGALTANSYGVPALLVKLLSLFFSSAWLVCHKLDMSSEYYPLIRTKYLLLFFMVPLLILDCTLIILYLYNLEPDIITSCCGVLFSTQTNDGFNLLSIMPSTGMLLMYSTLVLAVALTTWHQSRRGDGRIFCRTTSGLGTIVLWGIFYFFSLVVITVFTSPYVYAMPHHRCPFDLLKAPYTIVGYCIYILLHGAVIAGISAGIGAIFACRQGLAQPAGRLRVRAGWLSLFLAAGFLLMIAYYPLVYQLRGGEG